MMRKASTYKPRTTFDYGYITAYLHEIFDLSTHAILNVIILPLIIENKILAKSSQIC